MKYFFILLATLSFISTYAQKDKTKQWPALVKEKGTIVISKQSPMQGKEIQYDYNRWVLDRLTDKELFTVFLTAPYDNEYYVRISKNNVPVADNILVNNNKQNKTSFEVNKNDTIDLIVYYAPIKNTNITCNYEAYLGKFLVPDFSSPSQANFEELLLLARTSFKFLYPEKDFDLYKPVKYNDGLFYKGYADIDRGMATQSIEYNADEITANKIMEEWNNKIKSWLKDYNVPEPTKYNNQQLEAKGNYLYEELYEYEKKDENGNKLFNVWIAKGVNLDGNYTVKIVIL